MSETKIFLETGIANHYGEICIEVDEDDKYFLCLGTWNGLEQKEISAMTAQALKNDLTKLKAGE